MAAVAADGDIDAQPLCSFNKAAHLIAELAGQEQQTRVGQSFVQVNLREWA
jgi:hypothetical protein